IFSRPCATTAIGRRINPLGRTPNRATLRDGQRLPRPSKTRRPMMAVPSFRDLANKANAQKSTGPRTEAGKAKSRMNGLKHGLCCVEVVPEADREEYEARCARWVVEQGPEADADVLNLRRAVKAAMQLDRCGRREAKLVDQQYRKLLETKAAEAQEVIMRTL